MSSAGGVSGSWVATLGQRVFMRSCGIEEGDFSGAPPNALERADGDVRERVTWLHQVHGSGVVTVGRPGEGAGSAADAAVSDAGPALLLVRTADCAPVGLGSPQGVAGVAHVGWKGLAAGVLQATVQAMHDLGASDIEAGVGPCIHAECYTFSPADLKALRVAVGDAVMGRTSDGRPAVDLVEGVRSVLAGCGVATVAVSATCTHCSTEHWSWRARRDAGRQATVVWSSPLGGPQAGAGICRAR